MKSKRSRFFLGIAAVAVLVATSIAVLPMARRRAQNVRLGREWSELLVKHAGFSSSGTPYPARVGFNYSPPTDESLRKLRDKYGLKAIAGPGSEIDRIVNLTRWVFRLNGHADMPEIPKELNALSLIPLARDRHILINCYMKTVILNEVFLAMGFPSRQTHLLPHSREEEESHFITSVYARTPGKWILMDPDCGAYVIDAKGLPLGVAEIRRLLVAGRPLTVVDLNAADRGTLATAWSRLREFVRGVCYPWFLSEFVFKIRCPRDSAFDQRSSPDQAYFELIPDDYRPEFLLNPGATKWGAPIIYLNDEALFWQKPAEPDH
jgi:hypothetical protein